MSVPVCVPRTMYLQDLGSPSIVSNSNSSQTRIVRMAYDSPLLLSRGDVVISSVCSACLTPLEKDQYIMNLTSFTGELAHLCLLCFGKYKQMGREQDLERRRPKRRRGGSKEKRWEVGRKQWWGRKRIRDERAEEEIFKLIFECEN